MVLLLVIFHVRVRMHLTTKTPVRSEHDAASIVWRLNKDNLRTGKYKFLAAIPLTNRGRCISKSQ